MLIPGLLKTLVFTVNTMSTNVPNSIGVIPDGNRRYSEKTNQPVEAAYLAGFRKVEESIDWAISGGINSISYWALSIDNFKNRSQFELSILFGLMQAQARHAISSKQYEQKGAKIRFFGETNMLPESLQKDFNALEQSTAKNNALELNIGVAYGGRDEVLQAAKRLAQDSLKGIVDPAQVDERKFSEYFYLQTPPDLVIRTGGMQRLSGFMPWHTGYSELFFSQKYWPEFQHADFKQALDYYSAVKRNFGK